MKRINKKMANAIQNEMLKVYTSPFKVLNFINANRGVIIGDDGSTIADLLLQVGIRGKLTLDHLCNFVEGDYKVICTLQKVNTWVPYYESNHFVKLGSSNYMKIPVEYSVSGFIRSLNDQLRTKENRTRLELMYFNLFDRIREKEIKELKRERERGLRAERTEKRKAVKAIAKAFKAIPVYSNMSSISLLRAAISAYNAKVA